MGARSNGYRKEVRDGSVRWVIDFRYLTKAGRTKRYRKDARIQSASGASTEAQRLMRYALEHGSVEPEATVPTFKEFVKGKFTELAMPTFRKATQERYERLLLHEGIVDLLGAKHLDEIGTPEHRALNALIVERNVDPRPHLAILRTVMREAYELGVIKERPRLPSLPPKQRKVPCAPPPEIVSALLNASTGWLRTAIALAFFASQRSGEVRAARVLDADFTSNMVFTRKAFSADVIVTPKNGSERAMPMAEPLREILQEAAKDKKPMDNLVVDEEKKTPSRQKLYKAFVALQERLGISPAWSFHALRHGFGSYLVQLGANIEAVREMMGHGSLSITTQYVHATSSDKMHAIKLLVGNWRERKK